MDKIVINGGNRLTGEVNVEGAKKCCITCTYSVITCF